MSSRASTRNHVSTGDRDLRWEWLSSTRRRAPRLYVFLLDLWWNPAVEAQAIDRSHRIGQTRPVMAYRLIAKNTVEDKILELQCHKRQLAEDILSADKRGLGALEASDLDVLLG